MTKSVLILGARGMLGSALIRGSADFLGTTHHDRSDDPRVLPGIDITCLTDLRRAFDWAKPQTVINCVGVVKSECDQHNPDYVRAVNGSAPHVLANLAASVGCRVIHVSTDCVFDGSRGARTENDTPDATDLYGQSKAVGELLNYEHCVTLRTSFIGTDRVHCRGLLEWLIAQERASGYSKMMWSGLSAIELARVIGMVLTTELSGLYHVAGPDISKSDLLRILIEAYGLSCQLNVVDGLNIDRTLNGSKFQHATGYAAPTWIDMAKELARAGT